MLALWALSLLAVFSASIGYGARQKATLLDRLDSVEILQQIAASGIETAKGLFQIPDPTPGLEALGEDWANHPSLFKEVPVGTGHFTVGEDGAYGMTDEERKLNLNQAVPDEVAALLILAAGADPEEAQKIGYGVADWRDGDSAYGHPQYGAEDGDYEDLDLPYACKDAPFELVEELMLVKGMNRDLFEKVEPFVTVYGEGFVNVNTAAREVLMSLGISQTLADKILLYRLGTDAAPGTSDDRFFEGPSSIVDRLKAAEQSLDFAEETALNNLLSVQKIETFSTYFKATSTAVLNKNGASLKAQAVMDRKGRVFYARFFRLERPRIEPDEGART